MVIRLPGGLRAALLCFGVCSVLAAALGGCAAIGSTVVYEKQGRFGPLFVTDDADGLRSMRFGRHGATQSSIKVGDPGYLHFDYLKLVLAGFGLAEAPRRVLIVGLGGGALPVFLRRHYPLLQIDAAEIDPEVLTAATLHFGFRQDDLLKAHVGDGRSFIENTPAGRYDLIILDAFGSTEVPAHLATEEFLLAVRRALAPSGVAVSNLWKSGYNRKYDAMLRTYQDVFATVDVVETARDVNTVLFALPRVSSVSRDQFVARARQLSVEKNYRFNLGMLVDNGYLGAPPKRPGVPVLRDDDPAKAP